MNMNFEPYLLAREYGWQHNEIMSLTRPEALYYILAPTAYERYLARKMKKAKRGSGRCRG